MSKHITDQLKAQTNNAEIISFIDGPITARLEGKNPKYPVPTQSEVEHVLDYLLKRDAKAKKLKLRKASYEQVEKLAKQWVERMNKKAAGIVEAEDDVEVIKQYKDGYRWVRLIGENAYKREGKLMSHCLSGDTEVITDQGVIPIKELAGKAVNVMTRNESGFGSWVSAPIKSYGMAALYQVTLSNGKGQKQIINTTDKHRWYGYTTKNKQHRTLTELTTFTLEPGYEIPIVRKKRPLLSSESEKGVTLSPVGIQHGLAFGDGTTGDGRYTRCDLYGDKASLLTYFSSESRTKRIERSIGGVSVEDLPNYFKEVPNVNENASYLYGFLAGYMATDGHLSQSGNASLSSADYNTLLKTEGICHRLGLSVIGIKEEIRDGYKRGSLFRLSFSVGALPKEFFLLDKHAVNHKEAEQVPTTYTVESIVDLNRTEEVYCAEVPDTKCFVLRGNVLTGNCVASYYGNIRVDIYSLRDVNNNPHCTIETTPGFTEVNQCKGKGNGSIHSKYIKKIMSFFKEKGVQVRESELTHLGYEYPGEECLTILDSIYEPIPYITYNNKRFLYKGAKYKMRISEEEAVKYLKSIKA